MPASHYNWEEDDRPRPPKEMASEAENRLQQQFEILIKELRQVREEQQRLRQEVDSLRTIVVGKGSAQGTAGPSSSDPEAANSPSPSKQGRYDQLWFYLSEGRWEQADEETRVVMLVVVGREQDGWFDLDSIEQFPCQELQEIDRLWVKASNGRFGFSVQKRIWDEVRGDYFKFGDRIGWRKEGQWLTYPQLGFHHEPQPPQGHLPVLRASGALLGVGSGIGTFRFSTLAKRLAQCNL